MQEVRHGLLFSAEDEEEDDGSDMDDAYCGASGAPSMDSGDDEEDSEGWRTADEDVGGTPGEDADGAGAYPAVRGVTQERHVSSRTVCRHIQPLCSVCRASEALSCLL